MADERRLRESVMRAVGAASIAATIIERTFGWKSDPTLVQVHEELVRGVGTEPRYRLQTCAAGVHREWFAEGEGLECPWCRIAELESAPAAVASRASDAA